MFYRNNPLRVPFDLYIVFIKLFLFLIFKYIGLLSFCNVNHYGIILLSMYLIMIHTKKILNFSMIYCFNKYSTNNLQLYNFFKSKCIVDYFILVLQKFILCTFLEFSLFEIIFFVYQLVIILVDIQFYYLKDFASFQYLMNFKDCYHYFEYDIFQFMYFDRLLFVYLFSRLLYYNVFTQYFEYNFLRFLWRYCSLRVLISLTCLLAYNHSHMYLILYCQLIIYLLPNFCQFQKYHPNTINAFAYLFNKIVIFRYAFHNYSTRSFYHTVYYYELIVCGYGYLHFMSIFFSITEQIGYFKSFIKQSYSLQNIIDNILIKIMFFIERRRRR